MNIEDYINEIARDHYGKTSWINSPVTVSEKAFIFSRKIQNFRIIYKELLNDSYKLRR